MMHLLDTLAPHALDLHCRKHVVWGKHSTWIACVTASIGSKQASFTCEDGSIIVACTAALTEAKKWIEGKQLQGAGSGEAPPEGSR